MNPQALSIQSLRITLNGTFLRATTGITDADIDRIITAARSNEVANNSVLLDVRRIQIGKSTVSVFVYNSTREVYFLPDANLWDTIAAYLVIIEVGGREFAIFRKSCANITPELEEHYELATYNELINTFDDSRSKIQKLSTREMSVSDKGMRSRSYEAADLKGQMSPYAAGRSIPRFTQIRLKDEVRSLSLTTGRINKLTDRASIPQAVQWAEETFALMAKTKVNKTFFSSFAQRVSLEEVLKHAQPASILFERGAIEEHLAVDKIDLWYAQNGVNFKLKPRSLKRILNSLDAAFEVDSQGHLVGTRSGSLKVNKKTISPQSRALQRLKIKNGKGYITFQSWITDNGYFVVSFNRPEYLYIKKNCFQDKAGRSEVDSIMRCLQPITGFANATSEKGAPGPLDTCFDSNSLFHEVEQFHSGDDYIFCDDLGNEWADHIAVDIKSACVAFIHSKHANKASHSASALHEVVGQAIKNLGNMHFNFETFSSKVNQKFKKTYGSTQIQRTRRGNSTLANMDIKGLLSDHRLHRKCIVACSTLSRTSIALEFARMKGGLAVKGNVTQLFWIISSFIHSALGNSTVPIIYCRP